MKKLSFTTKIGCVDVDFFLNWNRFAFVEMCSGGGEELEGGVY
jgi:hypothetical protein